MNKHIINIDDQTTYVPKAAEQVEIKENILIVGSFQKGKHNKPIQFYPGEFERFVEMFGTPNYFKYGIGPNIAVKALDNNLNMGVLAVNLRPADAKIANAMLLVKHKVIPDVQKTNEAGDPLYLTPANTESTVAEGNTPIKRDILEIKLSTATSNAVTSEETMITELEKLYSDTADNDGYVTRPLFAFYYVGAGAYGDNLNLRMVDRVSPYTGEIAYDVELFNGMIQTYVNNVSIFPDSEAFGGVSTFIENVMKSNEHMNVISSPRLDEFLELVAEYTDEPKKVNLFDINDEYKLRNHPSTIDITAPLAIRLQNGSDGNAQNLPAMFKDFFDSKVVKDLDSITRYRIDIIPDLEYSGDIKTSILGLITRRTNTTQTVMMLGEDTFESAIAERMNTYDKADEANCLFIAACQNPASQDAYVKRTLRLPAIFYAMDAYINSYKKNLHSFFAFAGASVRWQGFDEESLLCPPYNKDMLKSLEDARINVVMMDGAPGAYIASQSTNTRMLSDRTEFNNMRLISHILYDINRNVHENGFKFNDIEDIARFQEKLQLEIYPEYRQHVSGISATVHKKGLTGEDKNTNIIKVLINFKDLSKATETTLTITDKEVK